MCTESCLSSLALLRRSDSGLDCGLCYLALTTFTLLYRLDDTYSNGLSHVTHSESTERGVVGESFDAHRLLGNHLDDGSITRLDIRGVVLDLLAATTINLLQKITELAGNVRRVAIDDRCIAGIDLARVVQDDNLNKTSVKCSIQQL